MPLSKISHPQINAVARHGNKPRNWCGKHKLYEIEYEITRPKWLQNNKITGDNALTLVLDVQDCIHL